MRVIWNTLESIDRWVITSLDKVDDKLGREPVIERTKKKTVDVHAPQRVIEFDR